VGDRDGARGVVRDDDDDDDDGGGVDDDDDDDDDDDGVDAMCVVRAWTTTTDAVRRCHARDVDDEEDEDEDEDEDDDERWR